MKISLYLLYRRKGKCESMKKSNLCFEFARFVITIAVSMIGFKFIKISFNYLALILMLIFFACILLFRKSSNVYYRNIISMGVAVLIGCIIARFSSNDLIFNKCTVFLCGVIFVEVVCMFIKCLIKEDATLNDKGQALTPQQEYDIERLEKYLDIANTIGINGEWGAGKSFITNKFIEKHKDEYIVVVINLLTCDVDSIPEILVNRLSSVLSENSIFSIYSNKLTKMFKTVDIYKDIAPMFFYDSYSYGDIFSGFKGELARIKKPILLVFEDIDRIKRSENLAAILSVTEQLASDTLKVIYQYDEEHMLELGYDRNYLEKYMPYMVNVTPPDLMDIIYYFLPEYENLKKDDFRILSLRLSRGLELNIGDKSYSLHFTRSECSIRRIKNFLVELNLYLGKMNIFHLTDDRELAVSFCFIKHCLNGIYREIYLGAQMLNHLNLLDVLNVRYCDKHYSIAEVFKKIADNNQDFDIQKLLDDPENGDKLAAIMLLGFEPNYKLPKIREKDSIFKMEIQNKKERKNRLIWYMIYEGESEYTDYEAIALGIKEVLNMPYDQQEEEYHKFWETVFYRAHYKNNNTVQKLGERSAHCVFKAMYIADIEEKYWLKWIQLYFDMTNISKIDYDLIDDLFYCKLNSRRVYIDVIERFNALEIAGNLNGDSEYRNFIIKYLEALLLTGYIDTYELNSIRYTDSTWINKNKIFGVFEEFEKKLTELKRNTIDSVKSIGYDIDKIIDFMDKNKSILNTENVLERDKSPRIETKMKSHYMHQDKIDELLKIDNNNEFKNELSNAYDTGDLGAAEVAACLKLYKKECE